MKTTSRVFGFFKKHLKFLIVLLVPLLLIPLCLAAFTFPTWGPYSCRANENKLTELYDKSRNGSARKNASLAEQVKNFSDSDQNPNCLFVSSLYSVSTYQLNEAEGFARALKEQKSVKISEVFLKDVHEDPSVYLEKRINTAKKIQAENQKNFIGIGEVKGSEK